MEATTMYAGGGRPSTPDMDKWRFRELENIPEVFLKDGTMYPRPIPASWPDPWPSNPLITAHYLSSSRFPPPAGAVGIGAEEKVNARRRKEVGLGTRPPPAAFKVPDSYLKASYRYFADVADSWDKKLLRDGEGFTVEGRPKPISREHLYMGEKDRWKPTKLREGKVLPQVQKHRSDPRTRQELVVDGQRREFVRRAFLHLWESYKASAWGHDELCPLSNTSVDPFSGWGATIVDTLQVIDTLLLFELEEEYLLAREHVVNIDFTYLTPKLPSKYPAPSAESLPPLNLLGTSTRRQPLPSQLVSPTTVPAFETVIRYLGGLLAAHDLSHDPLMLERARELGDWMLPSLGTKSGLGVPYYEIGSNPAGESMGGVGLAEAGSLSLEFTKLSQLTGDPIYFNAISRVTDTFDHWKSNEGIVGLFPVNIDPDNPSDLSGVYSLGGQADSYYEYLIKEYQLLGGASTQYSRMYEDAIDAANHFLVRSISNITGVPDQVTIGEVHLNQPINGGGDVRSWYSTRLDHLTCFAAGMLGLGSRLLARPKDLETGKQFLRACTWAYDSTRSGLAPETMQLWSTMDPQRYKVTHLLDGTSTKQVKGDPVGRFAGSNYHIQRPETIESVWYMYRLTGDRAYQDQGWKMFCSWVENTIVAGGFAHVGDVNARAIKHDDSGVESFVYAETLKYYYLLFSPPTLLSLDEWVFTTEAHPFRLPSGKLGDASSLWKGGKLEIPSGPLGQGTNVQQWARVMQAGYGRGWDERAAVQPPGV